MTRLSPALALALLLGVACGAPATSSPSTTAAPASHADEDGEWTAAMLRLLDPALRAEVRRGSADRLAIKVYFLESPSDAELSALLLSRVGNQVVGSVQLATLHEIAARDDVDRIEALTDVGY